MLWYYNDLRGVTVSPKQKLLLDKWVSFSDVPTLNPLLCSKNNKVELESGNGIVHLMLETNVYPDMTAIEKGLEILKVCLFKSSHNRLFFLIQNSNFYFRLKTMVCH